MEPLKLAIIPRWDGALGVQILHTLWVFILDRLTPLCLT